ncbi:MAG TPA: glycosyl hydrolase family 18 protein [Candidatus Polarisedimenticolaceae bacterium]|nr:glycosyl hydrolase family 18 protein [Candidatus Polarisedimenticolaceae bacterium]
MPLILAALLGLGGWVVPWQRDAGLASLDRAGGAVGDVFLFAARLDGEGRPVLDGDPATWTDAVRRGHAAKAKVWLTVVNDRVASDGPPALKDADIVHRILAEPAERARHVAGIAALAQSLAVDGVDVDYENLPAEERDAFSAFAGDLASALKAHGMALSVTVQPKRGETSARGPGAMDWPRLCRTADRVQVMLYNEHNASTEPGPIAGPAWIGEVIDYGLGSCPVAKLVPVLKVSGMDWGPSRAEWKSFAEVAATRAATGARLRRERSSRVPWLVYEGPDGRHVVYFEDARSLEAKASLLAARGIGSVVLWSLGSEDPEAVPRVAGVARRTSQKR